MPRRVRFRATARRAGALALTLAAASAGAQVGDVPDQFFRYADSEHKVYFSELPGETVDPFTGTLSVVQTDLVLPGKAGLDLRIVRTYSSKIWGRTDLLQPEPLLAEKERSVLGYGWSFHMGRLKDPNADGSSGFCGGSFPVYEAPDGTARVFYRTATAGLWTSKDFWLLRPNCSALGVAGACMWSNTGTRFEFLSANQYYYGAGTTVVWPASAIVDALHPNNRIELRYRPRTGAISDITDTYGRIIQFGYTAIDNVTDRLDTMTANGRVYSYGYTRYQSGCTAGCYSLPGAGRDFLTTVQPPAGPAYRYQYATGVRVAENQYALRSITYPAGGTVTYTYGSTPFFTGYDSVPFAVVTARAVAGRGVTPGTWQYSYSVPGQGSALNVTTISRPDGSQDRHSMYGVGYVLGRAPSNPVGNTWMVGLTREISRADGAEVETNTWETLPATISTAHFAAPVYSTCGVRPIYDVGVKVAVLSERLIARDGATYRTTFSSFDAYGQARTVTETGTQSAGTLTRTTTWTFSPVTDSTVNWVRGRPSTHHAVVGTESVDNSWTYYGAPGYARKTETLAGVTTTFAYDADGNLSSVTNARNQSLGLSGYVAGHGTPTRLTFNNAFTNDRTTTWEGWISTQSNGRGYTTTYDHDAIGRVTRITPPSPAAATSYAYATDGSNVVMSRGTYSKTTTLDGLGRETSSSDSESVLTSTRWDAMGRAWFRSFPYDTSTGEVGERLGFDGLDRVTSRTKAYRPATQRCDVAAGCLETLSYARNCTTVAVQRAAGDSATTQTCFGSFGDPGEKVILGVTDAESGRWTYTYDAHRDLKTVTAPLSGGNRSFGYFPNTYFLQAVTSGETGTTTYGRNALGQMTSKTDARNVVATYGYEDPLSRLRSITYGAGSPDNVARDYDDESNLTAVSSTNGGAFTYAYDALNRMESQIWTFGGRPYTTAYHYTAAGCLDSITYPTGTVVTMTCDTANRPTAVRVNGTTIAGSIAYHPSGQPRSMIYGGSAGSTSVVYDDRARMHTKRVASGSVLGLSYGYDGADNVTSFGNSAVANSARTMAYDKLDRIITSVAPSQWGSAAYDYDALGNRLLKSEAITTSYAYDASTNRLASLSSREPLAPRRLTWDVAGRLASTSDGASYLYDGLGRRVQKTDASGTTVYHYDAGGRVIAETRPDGTKLRDYLYLGNQLIAVDGCITNGPPNCSEREWYHTDALGTPLARTDASGTVTARYDNKAWGEPWAVSGMPGDRQYNGRVYDAGTGFHDYGARLYWPEIGRFVSADTNLGSPADPRSLNRYSYVLNNPYKYVDPTGRTPEGAFKGAMVGGAVGGAVGFVLGGGGGLVLAAFTGGAGTVVVPPAAIEGGALGSGIGIAIGHWIGDLVSGPEVMQSKSLQEQAADLVPLNNGRSRVTLDSPGQRMEVDLTGKSHAGVPTPHTKVSERNTKAPESAQPAYNTKKAETKPATQEDIRTVRRALERR